MPKVVVTGAGAGIGRAAAIEFARHGCDVALLSRDPDRLEHAAAQLRRFGVRTLPSPIDAWVNVAMATVCAPVSKLTAAEVSAARSLPASARSTA